MSQSLRPNGYLPRVADKQLQRLLGTLGAVEVTGPMWCGKTWTSLNVGRSLTRLQERAPRQAAQADPNLALLGEAPHVIDEWQRVPEVWDAVRDAVDENGGAPGQYVLTGSWTPHDSEVYHSGAGRIGRLAMRTMTLSESGESSASVSLAGLFEHQFKPVLVQQGLMPLARAICRGGWPALVKNETEDSAELLQTYFDAIYNVTIPHMGLDPIRAQRVMQGLARNDGASTSIATIAQDAGLDGLGRESARKVAERYVNALRLLFLVCDVPGWDAPIRSKSRLRDKPKRYLTDPSLTASLLGVTPERLAQDGQTFGLLFESLCMRDLAVYAAALPYAAGVPVRYYRDSDGLEVDAIIELRDGRWAALEIKLGENKVPDAARSLTRLERKVANNPAARNPSPEFKAVVVGAGAYARYDKDLDVYIIPITSLGA